LKIIIFFNLIIASRFFGAMPFSSFDWNSLSLFFVVFTFVYTEIFAPKKGHDINVKNEILIVLISLFLGTAVAYLDWQQSFEVSIVAMRGMTTWFLLQITTRHSGMKEDLFVSLKWFTYLYIGLVILCFVSPQVSVIIEGLDKATGNIRDEHLLVGLNLVVLYYYWRLSRLQSLKVNVNRLIVFFIFFWFIFFLVGNRTTILTVTLLSCYFLFSLNKGNKILLIIGVGLIVFIVGTLVFERLELWYTEALEQVSDDDYNRNKALIYYLNDYSRSILGYIFGNGFASGRSDFGKLLFSNMDNGIFQSDLGLLGLWTHYGVLIIFLILRVLYSALKLKKVAIELFLMGWHVIIANILFSAITPEHILFWVIFISLIKIQTTESSSKKLALFV